MELYVVWLAQIRVYHCGIINFVWTRRIVLINIRMLFQFSFLGKSLQIPAKSVEELETSYHTGSFKVIQISIFTAEI